MIFFSFCRSKAVGSKHIVVWETPDVRSSPFDFHFYKVFKHDLPAAAHPRLPVLKKGMNIRNGICRVFWHACIKKRIK